MKAFTLPDGLEAGTPPAARDDVRLLVARPDGIEHSRFARLGEHLGEWDADVAGSDDGDVGHRRGIVQRGRPSACRNVLLVLATILRRGAVSSAGRAGDS